MIVNCYYVIWTLVTPSTTPPPARLINRGRSWRSWRDRRRVCRSPAAAAPLLLECWLPLSTLLKDLLRDCRQLWRPPTRQVSDTSFIKNQLLETSSFPSFLAFLNLKNNSNINFYNEAKAIRAAPSTNRGI